MNDEKKIWITNMKDVPTANAASLMHSLVTLDGRGKQIKSAVLEEILRRTYQQGFMDGKNFKKY